MKWCPHIRIRHLRVCSRLVPGDEMAQYFISCQSLTELPRSSQRQPGHKVLFLMRRYHKTPRHNVNAQSDNMDEMTMTGWKKGKHNRPRVCPCFYFILFLFFITNNYWTLSIPTDNMLFWHVIGVWHPPTSPMISQTPKTCLNQRVFMLTGSLPWSLSSPLSSLIFCPDYVNWTPHGLCQTPCGLLGLAWTLQRPSPSHQTPRTHQKQHVFGVLYSFTLPPPLPSFPFPSNTENMTEMACFVYSHLSEYSKFLQNPQESLCGASKSTMVLPNLVTCLLSPLNFWANLDNLSFKIA